MESHICCFKLPIQITLLLSVSLYSFLKSSSDEIEVTITFYYAYCSIKKVFWGLNLD